jgi:glutaminyl-peptide cyclotransferase
MPKTIVILSFIFAFEVLRSYTAFSADPPTSTTVGAATKLVVPPEGTVPDLSNWDGERAMNDIREQLSFGTRSLGTVGHESTIEFIKNELSKTSATLQEQRWTQVDKGKRLNLTNIIARFDPENPRRIIAGTHYDSIVRAYRDADHPDASMPGANNSASGVALLLETARVLDKLPTLPTVGIDLVFFDGEEGPISLGAGDPDWRALGSPYFAEHIDGLYSNHRPLASVIFDMVCYKELRLSPEVISLRFAKQEVDQFWKIGSTLAPGIFAQTPAPLPISDDQVALDSIGIPSFLVIGFAYEPWFNTTKDTIDKCSPRSLEAVGRTLLRYLYLVN